MQLLEPIMMQTCNENCTLYVEFCTSGVVMQYRISGSPVSGGARGFHNSVACIFTNTLAAQQDAATDSDPGTFTCSSLHEWTLGSCNYPIFLKSTMTAEVWLTWMTKVLSAMVPARLCLSSSLVAKTVPRPVAASLPREPCSCTGCMQAHTRLM